MELSVADSFWQKFILKSAVPETSVLMQKEFQTTKSLFSL